jgi:hypothetical protein
MSNETNKPKMVFYFLIILIIVSFGIYYWQQTKVEDLQSQVAILEEQVNRQPDPTKTVDSPTDPTTKVIKPNDKDEENEKEQEDDEDSEITTTDLELTGTFIGQSHAIEKADGLIDSDAQDQLNERKEIILGAAMPINADNSSKFYFSTLGLDEDKYISRIYSYNTSTNKLQEVYWEKSGNELWLWGINQDQLIIHSKLIDSSPAPCFSPWLDASTMLYLDLTQPEEGTFDYEVPDSIMEQAEVEQDQCEADTF